MESVAVCQGASIPTSFEFTITESTPPVVEGYEVDICAGGEVEIEPIVQGGSGGFLYEWNTMETTQSITVSPAATTVFSVSLSDTCLVTTDATDITVTVAEFPELTVNATPNSFTIDCNWFAEDLNMSAAGGDGTYSYQWLNQDGNNLGFGSNLFLFDNTVEEIVAQVTDGCGTVANAIITPDVQIVPFELNVPTEIEVCPGSLVIDADISGEAPFFISWFDQSDFSLIGEEETLELDVTEDMTLSLNASDNCGGFDFQTIQITVNAPVPLEIEQLEDVSGGCLEEIMLEAQVNSGVPPYSYQWESEDGDINANSLDLSFSIEQDELITLTVLDECNQSTEVEVNAFLVMEPLVLDIPESLEGDCLTNFEIIANSNYGQDPIFTWEGDEDLDIQSSIEAHYLSNTDGIITLTGDAGCGNIASSQTEITIIPSPITVQVSPDTTICFGGQVFLNGLATGGTGPLAFTWNTEDQEIIDNPITQTPFSNEVFTLVVSDVCENQAIAEVEVTVQDLDPTFTIDEIGFSTDEYLFTPTEEDCLECSFQWLFTDGNDSQEIAPLHLFEFSGIAGAELTVSTPESCSATYSASVDIPPLFYIPNAFTPDNDQVNDVWDYHLKGVRKFKMSVFNRWGELVYESTRTNNPWDGSFLGRDHYVPNGAYSYLLEYESFNFDSKVEKGTVLVLR